MKQMARDSYYKTTEEHRARSTQYYWNNREGILQKQKSRSFIREYGITEERFNEILESQGGHCAFPGCTKSQEDRGYRLAIDHAHSCCPGKRSCGKCIRGILCLKHNTWVQEKEAHLWALDWIKRGDK